MRETDTSKSKAGLVTNTGVKADLSNPTTREIAARIKQCGPIPYSDFMQLSLYGKRGYYSEGKVAIGHNADFITSAEASDMFGGMLGLAAYRVWEAMGKPVRFDIAELGAGQGGAAEGLLSSMKRLYPDFYEAIHYTIIDISTKKMKQQRKRLRSFNNKISWQKKSLYECNFSHMEGVILSNEIPDAAPVDIVKRVNGRLVQKFVTLHEKDGNWVEDWHTPQPHILQFIQKYNIQIRESVEEPINMSVEDFQRVVGTLKKGAVITIDYGSVGEVGRDEYEALRFFGKTVKNGEKSSAAAGYRKPGNTDITASVNFSPLVHNAARSGLQVIHSTQMEYLGSVGGEELIAAAIQEKLRKVTSTEELKALYRETKDFDRFVQFCAVMTVTPGITVKRNFKGSAFIGGKFYPRLSYPGGVPHREYDLIEVNEKGEETYFLSVKADEKGNIPVDLHYIMERGNIVTYHLTDPVNDEYTQETVVNFADTPTQNAALQLFVDAISSSFKNSSRRS